MIFPPFGHGFWWVPAFLVGACVGSFLNVVIYRLPLGLSVNEPKRSFCPHCKKTISFGKNIPLLSWLLLRGKCADCGAPISGRYITVEFFTALFFLAIWIVFPPQVAVFLWVMAALFIAITFIDAEHMIIPVRLTWAGAVTGLAACAIWPQLPVLASDGGDWLTGLKQGAIGWVVGFFGLWAVVELGKMAFGKKALIFEKPVAWSIRESTSDDDPMLFVIGDEEIQWWDIFFRKTDRLIVETSEIRLSGEPVGGGSLIIRELEIELPDGKIHRFEDIKSLDGMATKAVIPREAMGMGDVHLLGMIGAFFGWTGVLFALFSSSIFALFAALVGRIGFGKQLPFGPFLILGAVAWMFGGWKLWAWYVEMIGPVGF